MKIKIILSLAAFLLGTIAHSETKQLNSDDIVDVEELYKNSITPPPPPKPAVPPVEKPELTDRKSVV